MIQPVLYSFRRCPYAMRARMALHIAGIEVEHREVLLRDKPAAMLEASPKGTVPVLVKEDGDVIDESLDLMRWALQRNDPLNWLAADAQETHALIADNDVPFKHNLDRYKYASRYDDTATRGDTDTEHKALAEGYIATLEQCLSSSLHLTGNHQTLADIAIFPFIRQFANTDLESWNTNSFPKTRDWLARHLSSEIFTNIMVKHAVWTP